MTRQTRNERIRICNAIQAELAKPPSGKRAFIIETMMKALDPDNSKRQALPLTCPQCAFDEHFRSTRGLGQRELPCRESRVVCDKIRESK